MEPVAVLIMSSHHQGGTANIYFDRSIVLKIVKKLISFMQQLHVSVYSH